MNRLQQWMHSIRVTAKSFLANPGATLLMVALPAFLVILMGFFNSNSTKANPNRAAVAVALEDQGNAKGGAIFKAILESPEVKKVLTISDKPEVVIQLPKDFDEKLAKGEKSKLIIREVERRDILNAGMVEAISSQAGDLIAQQFLLERLGKTVEPAEIQKLATAMAAAQAKPALTKVKESPIRVLNSYEQNNAAIYGVMLTYMILLGVFNGMIKDREEGTFSRLQASPNKPIVLFNHYVLNAFCTNFIATLLYMFGLRLFKYGYTTVNPLFMVAAALILSLINAGLVSILLAFRNKTLVTSLMMLLMYAQMFLGGVIMPKFFESPLVDKALNLIPAMRTEQFLRQLQLTGSLSHSLKELYILLPIVLILYLAASILVPKTWEV